MKDRGIQCGACGSFDSCLASVVLLLASSIASAADLVQVETILSNLRGPSAIAIRSTPGAANHEIYVAEVGAGRIVRLESDEPNTSVEAITGFVASTDDDDLIRLPGPHGMLFLDPNRLVVTGSDGEARPFVRLYELGDQKPLSAEQHEQQAESANGEVSIDVVHSFQNVARTLSNDKVPDFLVTTGFGKGNMATLWRLPVRSGALGDLKQLGNDQPDTSPVTIAVEPRGYIVVVRPVERDRAASSHMEFVNPMDGRTAVRFAVKLANVVGVAYSHTGNLYAISQSSGNERHGGVFRIDGNESSDPSQHSATATHVAEIQQPTAIAFGPNGAAYVTSFGKDRKSGTLHKITGL
jgi:hypothetical protein